MLLSTGERIACALVAMAIHDLGEEAVSLHRLAGRHPHRRGTRQGEDPRDPRRPRPRARSTQGKIVLVAGFQGFSRDTMEITTLGRGGTDATAVALAAALGGACEIYSDVAGRLHRRSAARAGGAQAGASSRTTRCSRWPHRARRC